MKTTQAVFNTSRIVLGTGHLIFQTLADACMNAEASVVAKTGYWEKGKQYELTPRQLLQYKAQRKLHTKTVQKDTLEKMDRLRKMIDDKKKIAFKQV